MPLLPDPILTAKLATAFGKMQPVIQTQLLTHLSNPFPRHTSLGVNEELKQGGVVENLTNSVYTVYEKVDKWATENNPNEMDTVEKRVDFKHLLWTETSMAWAETLSQHISLDIVNTMMTVLAPELAKIINDQIKSSSVVVTIPPGTLTVGVGAASILNPVPIELTLEPGFPIPDELERVKLPITFLGGLK